MELPAVFWHFANFYAPALGVAALVTLGGRIFMPKVPKAHAWWLLFAIQIIVCMGMLTLALMVYGSDGRMLGYAALVLASGTVQWVMSRVWRR